MFSTDRPADRLTVRLTDQPTDRKKLHIEAPCRSLKILMYHHPQGGADSTVYSIANSKVQREALFSNPQPMSNLAQVGT